MRVPIKTEVLIANAEKYLTELQDADAKAQKDYEAAERKARKEVITALKEIIKQIEDGADLSEYFGVRSGKVQANLDIDDWPVAPRDTVYAVERDLEALRNIATGKISIEPGDYYWRYLGKPEKGNR